MRYKVPAMLLPLLILAGCSGTPVLPVENVNRELTVEQALSRGTEMKGTSVLWGGVIVDSRNMESRTRIEILSYPLDDRLRPKTDKTAGRRFLAYRSGYLETVDYAPGRQISLVGTVERFEEAQVGEHHYRYPTVSVEQLHLWPIDAPRQEPRIHFGIGVMFHN